MEEIIQVKQLYLGYLDQLVELDLLHLQRIGKENFYINVALYKFLNEATQLHKLNEE